MAEEVNGPDRARRRTAVVLAEWKSLIGELQDSIAKVELTLEAIGRDLEDMRKDIGHG